MCLTLSLKIGYKIHNAHALQRSSTDPAAPSETQENVEDETPIITEDLDPEPEPVSKRTRYSAKKPKKERLDASYVSINDDI